MVDAKKPGVDRTLDHLLGVRDIAAHFEVGVSRVTRWLNNAGLPAPATHINGEPAWWLGDVQHHRKIHEEIEEAERKLNKLKRKAGIPTP